MHSILLLQLGWYYTFFAGKFLFQPLM